MEQEARVLAAERAFFDSLLRGDTDTLDQLLDPAFTMVGINGAVVARHELLGALGAGILTFERMDLLETAVRFHGPAAVVVGRTSMAGRMEGTPFTAASRYTHVYLEHEGGYRFVAAIQLHGVDPVARVVALVLAALSIGVGVVCLIDPFSTASSFAVVAGAFWFAAGAITWFGSWQRRGHDVAAGRAPGFAGGVFSMIIGILIMLFPKSSLLFLAVVLGCWLIFFGISAFATGLAARRLLKNVERAVLYWP